MKKLLTLRLCLPPEAEKIPKTNLFNITNSTIKIYEKIENTRHGQKKIHQILSICLDYHSLYVTPTPAYGSMPLYLKP